MSFDKPLRPDRFGFALKKDTKTKSYENVINLDDKYVGLENVIKELLQLGINKESDIVQILDLVQSKMPKADSSGSFSKATFPGITSPPPSPGLFHRDSRPIATHSPIGSVRGLAVAEPSKADRVIQSIIESEKAYVDALKCAVEVWLVPLSTNLESSKIIEKDDIKKIFSNIEIVYHLHKELLSDLNSTTDLVTNVGSIFKKRLPFMSIYSNYVVNWRTSASALNKYKDSKAFQTFKKNAGGELSDLLSKPLTRIYYYADQLKELEKLVPPNTTDIGEAIRKLTELSDFFHQNLDDSINLAKVNSIADSLIGCPLDDLTTTGRKFLREGELTVIEFGSPTGEKKAYRFFLFSDLLLYAKPENKKFKFVGKVNLKRASVITRSQRFSAAVVKTDSESMKDLLAKEKTKSPIGIRNAKKDINIPKAASPISIKNAIQIMSEDGMLSVCASTFEERDVWRQVLEELVDGYYQKRVFGIPLEEVLNRPNGNVDGVPVFLRNIFDFLMTNEEALKTEGLFRVSASSLALENYKEAIDSGSPVEFNVDSVHVVTNLIKLYFRELPDPIIPFNAYEEFTAVAADKVIDNRVVKYKKLLESKVPIINLALFKALVVCLRKVASYCKFNFMTPSNLGLILEPNILKKKVIVAPNYDVSTIGRSFTDLVTPVGFVEDCIEKFDAIFGK